MTRRNTETLSLRDIDEPNNKRPVVVDPNVLSSDESRENNIGEALLENKDHAIPLYSSLWTTEGTGLNKIPCLEPKVQIWPF